MSGADLRYSPEVERRFQEMPRAGDFAPGEPDALRASAGSVEQGAQVLLAIQVREGRILDARFQAYGCPHVLASASWLCDRLVWATHAELAAWDWREVAAALDVPPAKFGRLLTLQDAVRTLAGWWTEADVDSV